MRKKLTAMLLAVVMTAGLLPLSACARSAAATWQEQYDLGVRYLSEGNYREAIIAFNAAIEIDRSRADPISAWRTPTWPRATWSRPGRR